MVFCMKPKNRFKNLNVRVLNTKAQNTHIHIYINFSLEVTADSSTNIALGEKHLSYIELSDYFCRN